MTRPIFQRLVKLEARRGRDAVTRLSDAELAARIEQAERRLEAELGDDWETAYRAFLVEQAPGLLATWDRRNNVEAVVAKSLH